MPATNYTITGNSPTPISEFPTQADLFLYNADTANNVYLSETRGLQSSTGAILPPLATKRWVAGMACFAICDAGKTAQLNVSANAGEISNPAAIASSILAQGLAGQIASAIKVAGVPIIDAPVVLWNNSQAVATGATPTPSSIFDVTGYQSLIINITEFGSTAPGNYRNIHVRWYLDQAGTMVIGEDVIGSLTSGNAAATIPRRGPYVYIYADPATTNVNSTLAVTVAASYNVANRMLVRLAPNLSGSGATWLNETLGRSALSVGGLTVWSGSIPATTTQIGYPVLYPGSVELSIYPGQTGVNVNILDTSTSTRIENVNNTNTPVKLDFVAPPVPLQIQVVNTLGSAQPYTLAFKCLSAWTV